MIFVAIFPVLCEALTEGPAFTGMRHFLFVVPPLAVLAGIGFDESLFALSARRWLASWARPLRLSAALLWNASVLVRAASVRIHVLQPARRRPRRRGAALRDGLLGQRDARGRARACRIISGSRRESRSRFIRSVSAARNSRSRIMPTSGCSATRGWLESDFFIAPTHMNCDRVVEGRTIATIRRFGVPIGVVKDRRGITAKGARSGLLKTARSKRPPGRAGGRWIRGVRGDTRGADRRAGWAEPASGASDRVAGCPVGWRRRERQIRRDRRRVDVRSVTALWPVAALVAARPASTSVGSRHSGSA